MNIKNEKLPQGLKIADARNPKKHNGTRKSVNKIIKSAEVKALKEVGFSHAKIAKLLKLDKSTVTKYAKLSGEEITLITETMKKYFIAQDWQLSQKALSEIDNHLSDEQRLSKTKLWELTGLYKVTRDLLNPKQSANSGNSVAIQVNIDKDKFTIDRVDTPNS